MILIDFDLGKLFARYREEGLLKSATTPEEAVELIRALFPGGWIRYNTGISGPCLPPESGRPPEGWGMEHRYY